MNRIILVTALALAAIFFAFAAVAKEVGRATEGDIQARLFDDQGECPETTVRVELWVSGVKRFNGCALEQGDKVFIVWEDGDRGILARKLFKPGV
jgi:hypothetical protein